VLLEIEPTIFVSKMTTTAAAEKSSARRAAVLRSRTDDLEPVFPTAGDFIIFAMHESVKKKKIGATIS
jgi:hypothetical protein